MSNPKSVVCLQDGTPIPVMESPAELALRLDLIPVTTQTGATLYVNREHVVFLGENLVTDEAPAPQLEML